MKKFFVIWKESNIMKRFNSLKEAESFVKNWTGCSIDELNIYKFVVSGKKFYNEVKQDGI